MEKKIRPEEFVQIIQLNRNEQCVFSDIYYIPSHIFNEKDHKILIKSEEDLEYIQEHSNISSKKTKHIMDRRQKIKIFLLNRVTVYYPVNIISTYTVWGKNFFQID